MKIGSLILVLVLLFGATFYILGSVITNSARIRIEVQEVRARNQQLESQLRQQRQTCQHDIQILSQNAQQLQGQIRSQQEELALLQQSLDAERAARMEAEQTVETLKVQLIGRPRPPLTQNKAIWSLATPTSEYITKWAKVILTSSLIVLVLVSGYFVRDYDKAKFYWLLRFLNRTETTAVKQNLIRVRMTQQQCQEYRRWQRSKQQETYQPSLSQHEQPVSN